MGLIFFFLLLYFTNNQICTGEKEEIVLADWGRIRTQANEVLDRCSTDHEFLCQGNKSNVCSCKRDCRERGSCCIDHQGSEVAIRKGRSWSCLAVQTSLCHSHHLQMVSSNIFITLHQHLHWFKVIQVLYVLPYKGTKKICPKNGLLGLWNQLTQPSFLAENLGFPLC